jgi:hypothetical protein
MAVERQAEQKPQSFESSVWYTTPVLGSTITAS